MQDICVRARDLGFDIAGVIPIGAPRHAAAFTDWLAAGYHGEMAYLAVRAAERANPVLLAPDARSMILLAASYRARGTSGGQDNTPHPETIKGCAPGIPQARVARYACGPDYHDAIKPRLFALDAFIREQTGRRELGKVFVDTAPLLERDFAEQAGLGFIGRNCCLIMPGSGSWTVLAGLMVPEELEGGIWKRETGSSKLEAGDLRRRTFQGCGRCTRCLDACPTGAFVAPHVLDARRCISYLTIELRGPILRELRPLMGDWVFGCDVCQEVCPYNKQASAGFEPSADMTRIHASLSAPLGNSGGYSRTAEPAIPSTNITLAELLVLDDAHFRVRFRGTPVLRAKRRGVVRNACVAAGNSGDASLVPLLADLLSDAEPLVRGHAAWALGQIGGAEARQALRQASIVESDSWVRDEIALSTSALA
jgi:epoxyqueuosine reductase